MIFLLPFLPVFAAATVSIGEALGIGASVIGIGAAVKGALDYHQAKSLQENANAEYQKMIRCIEQKSKEVQKKLEDFGLLKLQTYTGVIREAVELLSKFISIDLSSFKDIQVERIRFFSSELAGLKESVVKASDVLSCLSVGVNTAVHDRIPYKDTPPIFQRIGAFGLKNVPLPKNGLPPIPYAAITMAGLSWGLSGSAAKLQAETNAVYASSEIEKMKQIEPGFDAILERIAEGENLINALTGKLRLTLAELKLLPESPETPGRIENAVSLTRALKQVIEVDICAGNGLLTAESGVLFYAVRKEHCVTA
jgi:hypothetical protein